MGYKELEFYCTKSDFVEPMCNKFSKWKNNGKLMTYVRHNNAWENKVLRKIANDSQWKLGIAVKCTGKGTPQRNQLAKLGFAYIASKARAMIVEANLLEEIKYKLCKECFNCAMYLSNLAMVTLNTKTATRYMHFHKQNHVIQALKNMGRRWYSVYRKNGKGGNRGIPMVFIGDAKNHAGDCYHMYNLNTGYMTETRDITWLHHMYYCKP